jgi:methyltransferase (TIGR00027 family)
MKDAREPSKTALGVAALRAAHLIVDGLPRILDDSVAELLLDGPRLHAMLASHETLRSPERTALRVRVLLRSRFAEERLADAVRHGVRQFVELGAGYGTFAYRAPAWARDVRIFEVDEPVTQGDKRARLARAGIAPPPNVTFVPIDFETTLLPNALAERGFAAAEPAFFSWLGVIPYLTRDAVEAVLRFVASCPTGSGIAFSFATPASLGSTTIQRVAELGEPWHTLLSFDDVRDMCAACGFSSVSFLEVQDALAFMGERDDGLELPPILPIACAAV